MMWIFGILLITKSCIAAASEATIGYKLELVQTIFRHGDRTPDESETYPTSTYNASIYEPYGYGQLTNVGRKRMFKFGQVLREQYGDFLGDIYKPSKVYAYSTDFDRTKMSLQLVLSGLYSPNAFLASNQDLQGMAFSTNYNRLELDFLQILRTCRRFWVLMRDILKSDDATKRLSVFKNTINYITNKAGYPAYKIENIERILLMFYLFESHQSMGVPLPRWLAKETYQELQEVTAVMFDLATLTPTMSKLATGATIRRFVDNMDNQEKNKKQRKMYLYSAHDTNVVLFLRAHGLEQPRTVPYGGAVIMEKLRGSDGEIYIRLRWYKGKTKTLTDLQLRDCNVICPLNKYLELIQPVLPKGSGTRCMSSSVNGKILKDMLNQEGPTNSAAARALA